MTLTDKGYVVTDDGRLEHRAVWESVYGPIPRGWHVHHVNEIKTDNDLSNLVCLPGAVHFEIHRAQHRGRARYTHAELMILYETYQGIWAGLQAELATAQRTLRNIEARIAELTDQPQQPRPKII